MIDAIDRALRSACPGLFCAGPCECIDNSGIRQLAENRAPVHPFYVTSDGETSIRLNSVTFPDLYGKWLYYNIMEELRASDELRPAMAETVTGGA